MISSTSSALGSAPEPQPQESAACLRRHMGGGGGELFRKPLCPTMSHCISGALTSDERKHHVNLAFADRCASIQVESLELEPPGRFGGGRVQDRLLKNCESLRLASLPSLRVQVAVLEIPAQRKREPGSKSNYRLRVEPSTTTSTQMTNGACTRCSCATRFAGTPCPGVSFRWADPV